MSISLKILVVLIVVTRCEAQPIRSDIASLAWLAGSWQMNAKGRIVDEQWMKPDGNMMMGMSRTVRDGKTLEYEYVRIVQNADSSIAYVAKPSGQEGASFTLMKLESNSAIFENTAHDFPQRIIYTLHTPDSLIARIEGTINGKARRISFPYRRVRCE